MDWWQMVLTFLANISWPIVAITIVTVLRKELSALLARVTKVSTPLGSLDAEARAIADDADKLDAKSLSDGRAPREIQLHIEDNVGLSDEVDVSPRQSERDISDLYEKAVESGPQDVPDEVEVLFLPAQRLVNVEPSEAVRLAWQAFRANLWKLELGEASEILTFRGPLLATLARLGFSEEFLILVKKLEDLSASGANLSPEGAAFYVDAAIRMASLVWFHWHDVEEHKNSG